MDTEAGKLTAFEKVTHLDYPRVEILVRPFAGARLSANQRDSIAMVCVIATPVPVAVAFALSTAVAAFVLTT